MNSESSQGSGAAPIRQQSIEPWRPAPERRRRWVPWVVALVMLILVVFASVATIVSLIAPVRNLPPRVAESVEQKHAKAREAFAMGATPAEAPSQIRDFFRRFQLAANDSDVDALTNLFDRPRFVAEIRRLQRSGSNGFFNSQSEMEFDEAINRIAEWPVIEDFEVRRSEDLGRGERLVHVQLWTSTRPYKTRWWFSKRQGRWRAFDFESLTNGLRVSDEITLVRKISGDSRDYDYIMWMPDDEQVATWFDLNYAVEWEDWFQVEQLLDSDMSEFPQALMNVVESWRVSSMLELGAPYQALELWEQSASRLADIPDAWLARARAENMVGRHSESLESAERYRSMLGDDGRVFRVMSQAHLGLGDRPRALSLLRQALDQDPDDVEALVTMAGQLPESGKREVAQRFQAMRRPDENLVEIGDALLETGDYHSLDLIIEANKPNLDRDPNLAYYAAQSYLAREQYADAADTMERVLDLAEEHHDASVFVDTYLEALRQTADWLDAYRRAPDQRYAFDRLAGMVMQEGAWKQVVELIDLRRKDDPHDPNIAYYQAQVLMSEEKYDEAAETVFPAIARAPEGETEYFADVFLDCMLNAGKAVAAHQRLKDRDYAMRHLSQALLASPDYPQLERLINAHWRHDRRSPWIGYFRGRMYLDQERFSQAARWLAPAIKQLPEEWQAEALEFYYRAMVADGRSVEVYNAVDDRREVFVALAWLAQEDFPDELEALIRAHRQLEALDPWLKFFEGESAENRGDWSAAVEFYRAGMALADSYEQDDFRVAIVYALEKDGRWREAYDQVPPQRETLDQVLRLTIIDQNIEQLEAILLVVRGDLPGDILIPRLELEISWLKGEYHKVLRLLTEHRDALIDQILVDCDYGELTIRTLVKLDRLDEARQQLDQDPDAGSLLKALVSAARGDVDAVIRAIEERVAEWPDSYFAYEDLYEDDMLGPLLRGEAMRLVREKYPEKPGNECR